MTTTLEYNGLGTTSSDAPLLSVRLGSWTSEPVYAEDGISLLTTQQRISGTALISATNDYPIELQMKSVSARFNEPRRGLKITVGSNVLVDTISGTSTAESKDDLNGPLPRFEFTEVVGANAILVSFTIVLHRRQAETSYQLADVIGHRWVQRWTYDEVGLAKRQVAGTLTVKANATEPNNPSIATSPAFSAISGSGKGPNPDAYRLLVVPLLPTGFRRIRQEFAVDETGTKLIYTIDDQEFTRGLPAPLKTGEASFSWAKDVDTVEGMLGTKVFEIEVTGEKNVPPVDLLAAAVTISKNRIAYSVDPDLGSPDWIREIRVEERNLLTENRIFLRVRASGIQDDSKPYVPRTSFMLTDILRNIQIGYVPPSPYGTSGAYSSLREDWTALQTGTYLPLPKAGHIQTDVVAESPVYTLPEGVFVKATAELIPPATGGGVSEGVTPEAKANFYTSITVRESVVVDTMVRPLDPMTPLSATIPFQFGKPKVRIVSEIQATRLNLAPERPFKPYPPNSILVKDDFNVGMGELDTNGNRVFVATYRREIMPMHVGGGSDPLFRLEQFNELLFVRFWPPENFLALPTDPRVPRGAVGSQEGTIFEPSGLGQYPVGQPDPSWRKP